MTLKTIQDMRSRSGVTLVELLVVILIVMILAVGLLPVFKRFVVEAQYASEPAQLIGHIRTQIALYQYEYNVLPVTNSCENLIFQYQQKAADGGKTFKLMQDTMASAMPNENKTYNTEAAVYNLYLKNMGLAITEYQGNRVAPQHAQLAVTANGTGYAYALGIFGDGTGLPANTGYAVYEAYFPSVQIGTGEESGYKLVATWKNYNGNGCSTSDKVTQIYFGTSQQLGLCAIPPKSTAFPATAYTKVSQLSDVTAFLDGVKCGKWSYTRLPE